MGIERIDTEPYLSWRGFLLSLRSRGLSGVRLVVSDAHEGLVRAVRESLPGAAWQRCIAHLERNVLERCRRKGDGSAAVAALKAALTEADPALVRAGYRRAVDPLAAVDERVDDEHGHRDAQNGFEHVRHTDHHPGRDWELVRL